VPHSLGPLKRCVCAPHNLSAGTSTTPRLSVFLCTSVIQPSSQRFFDDRAVVTGSHPEYYTPNTLYAFQDYVDAAAASPISAAMASIGASRPAPPFPMSSRCGAPILQLKTEACTPRIG